MTEEKDETYVRPHRRKNKKKNGTHKVKGHTRKKPGKRADRPRGGSCKGGSDYGDWEVDPDAMEKKVEELITEEGLNFREVIEWAEERDVLGVLKDTKSWEVQVNEDPWITEETLEEYLKTEQGKEYIEQHFEDLHEIPYGGAVKGNPYWLSHVIDGDSESVKLRDDDIIAHNPTMYQQGSYGDVFDGSELNRENDSDIFEEGKKYKYIGSEPGTSELEIQAEDGGLVYYNMGSNFFNAYRPLEDG